MKIKTMKAKAITSRLAQSLLLFACVLAAPAFAQQAITTSDDDAPLYEVKLTTRDKFELKADYLAGRAKNDGFLLLHDCQADRQSLATIANQLNEHEYHVLSLDLRGFGRSVSGEHSHDRVKRTTKDIITYQSKLAQLTAYWEEDVQLAYQYLKDKMDKQNQISILSAGCSTPYAVATAEKFYVANMVLLSPDMDYAAKERYKNLTDIASYFISSVYHVPSYQTSKELYEWNGHPRSTMLLFKGNLAGTQLLKRNKSLSTDIALWLSERAKKRG